MNRNQTLAFIALGFLGCGADGEAWEGVGAETTRSAQQALGSSPEVILPVLEIGETATVLIAGAESGARFRLYTSRMDGDGPCPPAAGGVCFGLVSPRSAGGGTINASGQATVSHTVPDVMAPGTPICFQAVVDRVTFSEPVCGTAVAPDGCVTAGPPTVFVATWGDNAYEGRSADAPVRNLSVGLSRATRGDVVEVAPGIYTPLDQLFIPRGVTLISSHGPLETIIDGPSCGFSCTQAVSMGTNASLIGFTFHNAPYYTIMSNGSTGVLIAGNIIDGDSHTGIRLDGGGEVTIVQNTIVNNTWGGITYTSSAGTVGVYNNIIAFHPEAAIDNDNWSDLWDIDWNVLYNPGAEYGETRVDNGVGENNLMTVDPRFVDPGARDYRLQSSSPAIDAGEGFWGLPGDCEAPDIGAIPFN